MVRYRYNFYLKNPIFLSKIELLDQIFMRSNTSIIFSVIFNTFQRFLCYSMKNVISRIFSCFEKDQIYYPIYFDKITLSFFLFPQSIHDLSPLSFLVFKKELERKITQNIMISLIFCENWSLIT